MIYLTDTNFLLRFSYQTDPRHRIVRLAARKLRAAGHQLQAVSQNFAEFWNASTRPIDRNGFGLTPLGADRHLRRIEQLFPLLPDSPAVYSEWRQLIVNYSVSGVQVYDARLVAAMISHGVTHILTFNTADFARYVPAGIVAVDPSTV